MSIDAQQNTNIIHAVVYNIKILNVHNLQIAKQPKIKSKGWGFSYSNIYYCLKPLYNVQIIEILHDIFERIGCKCAKCELKNKNNMPLDIQ
jgi:hypothetical protein